MKHKTIFSMHFICLCQSYTFKDNVLWFWRATLDFSEQSHEHVLPEADHVLFCCCCCDAVSCRAHVLENHESACTCTLPCFEPFSMTPLVWPSSANPCSLPFICRKKTLLHLCLYQVDGAGHNSWFLVFTKSSSFLWFRVQTRSTGVSKRKSLTHSPVMSPQVKVLHLDFFV